MNSLQHFKGALVNTDFTVDNAAYTCTAVDTKGYSYATFVFAFGNVPATVAALKITESDDNSSYSDISGSIAGTATDIAGTTIALPTAASGDGTFIVMQIALGGARKRYLKAALTAGNGSGTVTEACIMCYLSRAADMPVTATERGAAHIVRI